MANSNYYDDSDNPFVITSNNINQDFNGGWNLIGTPVVLDSSINMQSHINNGIDLAIDRGLSYSPYSDVLWCETAKPNIAEAQKFSEGIHKSKPKYTGKKMLVSRLPNSQLDI